MIPTTLPDRLRLPILLLASLSAILLAAAAPDREAPPAPGGWTHPAPVVRARPEDGRCPMDSSPFLLRATDARVVVTGPVAHTIVRQGWENPNREPVEGLYLFPLPDNAAVTDMRLQIGTRRIDAEMRRREEARAIYEQARAEGRVAGLLDQERPNLFAQRVANIMPGMRIEVTIEFDQEIRCSDGDCAYVLPTVVGPRFVPARQGDPGEIAPPVLPPGTGTGQRLSFRLELDAGMPARDLRSMNHPMIVEETRSGHSSVRLASESGERLDRDIEVRWRLGDQSPEFGVLAWRAASQQEEPGVFALYLMPPVGVDDDALAAPRELVFVLDCSGSMSGTPIEAAKNVVRRSLRAARPGDTLQLQRFSDRASGLWPAPVAATPENVSRALAYLDTLHGEGGTEMLSGIRAAFDRPPDPGRLRIVAFLTDGYIGNEAEILGEVRRLIGGARLFAFGIGSSVNRYLLENLAQEGHGVAAFLGPRETPDAMVDRFVARIATPVLTDIHLAWEGIEVQDLEPSATPDLFAGQPLVIHGRYRTPGAGTLVLDGRLRGRRELLRRTVVLPPYAADHEALGRLWARARIDRLTRESYGQPQPEVVSAVTDLGLRFHLMTPWTSLVAADNSVSNPGGEALPIGVPVEMPEGVAFHEAVGNVALSSLGYLGAALSNDAVHRAEPKAKPVTPVPVAPPVIGFRQILLVEENGTRRTIEAGGEAWLADTLTRRLVRTLPEEKMVRLRTALQTADVEHWATGDATLARGRARLIVVLSGGQTRSIALAAALSDPPALAVVALVRGATS